MNDHKSIAVALTLLVAVAGPAAAQHAEHAAGHPRFGNPADLDRYIENLQDPERDAWQHPDRVMEALGLRPGQTACDLGAGPGYFTLRLARAVGAEGRVYAVDVEPRILDALRGNIEGSGARNVTPVLGLGDDPLLPPGTCDLILIVNTYHHFPDPPAYLERLAGALAPGGRIANLDFREDAEHGPRHRIPRADFLEQARGAGYLLDHEESFLPQQYFMVLRPAP
jgi:ubiquinone/menaquinone biosynthesis C-methylase UbiE